MGCCEYLALWELWFSVFFSPCGYKFQSPNEALFSAMWRNEVYREGRRKRIPKWSRNKRQTAVLILSYSCSQLFLNPRWILALLKSWLFCGVSPVFFSINISFFYIDLVSVICNQNIVLTIIVAKILSSFFNLKN